MSRQNFQVAIENAIWARILGIQDVASNLGPKLLGPINRNNLKKVEEVRRTRASRELRTLLYYIFLLFSFSYFLRRLDLV